MAVLRHLVRQIQHSDIELDARQFAEIGQIIKEIGVTAFKMNGHYIAVRLNALHNKRLFSNPSRG